MAHSGLQREAINLYRSFLRIATQRKDGDAAARVKAEFRKYQKMVSVRDIEQIEYLLRRAKKQLTMFQEANVARVSTWQPRPKGS